MKRLFKNGSWLIILQALVIIAMVVIGCLI